MRHVSGEREQAQYWSDGELIQAGWQGLSQFMRCRRRLNIYPLKSLCSTAIFSCLLLSGATYASPGGVDAGGCHKKATQRHAVCWQ
jgi:hypothetical protein